MTVRDLLRDEAPSWVVLLASGILGAAIAAAIFGIPYLVGTSDYWSWPTGDAEMMLTGWEYYAHEPWHWPLGHTFGTNGSHGTNILFLDAIPLVAFAAKMVRTLTGGRWQPYGLWHLAIYVLQGVVAALLARRLGLKSLLAGLGVAMMSLSMFAFVCRFYHEGLNAHFVLLWALLAYFATEQLRHPVRIAFRWIACIGCAVLLHPYLGAMTALVAAAAFARLGGQGLRRSAQAAALTVAGLGVLLFVFGYVPQKLPKDFGDFGEASMNLMSLFVPYRSQLIPVVPLKQDATGLQWDGCNFLGLGVIALLLLSLVAAAPALRHQLASHKALACALGLLALFAPSNHWWFGETSILQYGIPSALGPILRNARATGRFFWPVGYALLIAVSTLVHRRFGRHGPMIVFVAGAIQLVDSTASWSIVKNSFAQPAKRELDWMVWAPELENVSKVNMYPSYQCFSTPDVPARVYSEEREIEFLAASRGARTNAGRTGRPLTDCAAEQSERAAAARGDLQDGEAYVFFKPAFTAVMLAPVGSGQCKEIGDAFLCNHAHREVRTGF